MRTKPSNYSFQAIRQYAEKISDENRLVSLGAPDLERFCREQEVTVSIGRDAYDPLSSLVSSGNQFEIIVAPFSSPQRRRFTIAHELGHFFLHYDFDESPREWRFTRGGSDLAETQANVFASSLLMPEQTFTNAWVASAGNIEAVAHQFQTSISAVRVRAIVLGLLQKASA